MLEGVTIVVSPLIATPPRRDADPCQSRAITSTKTNVLAGTSRRAVRP